MNILKNYNCSASIAHGILNLESGGTIDLNLIEETLAGIAAREASPDAACAQKALSSLRGQVEQAPTSSLNLVGVREVYIEAYANSDFGDGPSFAKLQVDQGFLDTLKRMQKICLDFGLTETRIFGSPDEWGPGEVADELRLQCSEMVITKDSFWFKDQPKHTDYEIETRGQSIAEFTEQVLAQPDNERLILGENIEYADLIDDGDGDSENEQITAVSAQDNPAG